jgi:hypothetical protein
MREPLPTKGKGLAVPHTLTKLTGFSRCGTVFHLGLRVVFDCARNYGRKFSG